MIESVGDDARFKSCPCTKELLREVISTSERMVLDKVVLRRRPDPQCGACEEVESSEEFA